MPIDEMKLRCVYAPLKMLFCTMTDDDDGDEVLKTPILMDGVCERRYGIVS